MDERLHGVLLAVSGDDSDLLRAIDARGSGLRVVRRCADAADLLSAARAGLAALVVVDTGFDEFDRSVVDRLEHAGATGIVLTPADQLEHWATIGWPVEDRGTSPDAVRARLQALARAVGVGRARRTSPAATVISSASPARPDDESDDRLWAELMAPDPFSSITPDRAGGASAASPPEEALARSVPRRSDAPDGGAARIDSARGPADDPGAVVDEPGGGLAVVWGPRCSSGRTTIAAALAHCLAPAGGSILVDADLEGPCLNQVLGLPEDSSGLATAARLAGHGRLDDETLEALLIPFGPSERLLSGLGRPGRWRELPPSAMSEVWRHCRRLAAWTIVDISGGPVDDSVDEYTLEPGRGAVAAGLVRNADVVLVVGGADPVGIRRLLQLLGDLDDEMRPTGRMEVVVTRVRSGVAGPAPQRAVRNALERYGRLSEVVLVPDDPVTADRCLMEGRPVTDAAPDSALGRALTALADRVAPEAAAARRPGRAARRRGLGLRRGREARGGRLKRARRSARSSGVERAAVRPASISVDAGPSAPPPDGGVALRKSGPPPGAAPPPPPPPPGAGGAVPPAASAERRRGRRAR